MAQIPETHRTRRLARSAYRRAASAAPCTRSRPRDDLSGADRVIIYSDGTVTDEHGEPIGNFFDED